MMKMRMRRVMMMTTTTNAHSPFISFKRHWFQFILFFVSLFLLTVYCSRSIQRKDFSCVCNLFLVRKGEKNFFFF